MNEGLFKSVAYAAKTRLNESGFDVRSGHLHEIIAALHGYDSNAAFRAAQTSSPDSTTNQPIVVLLDTERAMHRVAVLLPEIGASNVPAITGSRPQSLAAYAMARMVSECLEAVSTQDRIYLALSGINSDNAALDAYARAIVLADPIMAGVVDDPEARYRSTIKEGFSDDIARIRAMHGGPLKFPCSSCHVSEGRLHIELSDEYFAANEESGVVRVCLEGEAIGHGTYFIDQVRAEFAEGEYFDHIPEFSSYSSEDWD
jgi:hypothetical protein